MSRQRTINDQHFWRSPRLQSCTTEDKIALLHLLTCPDSNVVGAYPLIPRIAGAEVGWSPEQWQQVIDRLRANDLVWFDAERMFVWVRIWWEHHHAGQTTGPKLLSRTLDDIRRIPDSWVQPFLEDFRPRLARAQQLTLDAALGLKTSRELKPEWYGCGIDDISNLSRNNCKASSNSNNTTLTPAATASPPVDISQIPLEHQPEVLGALQEGMSAGKTTASPQAVVNALGRRFKSTTNPPHSPGALTHYLLNHLDAKTIAKDHNTLTIQERESLASRCYAWPPDHANSYVRIGHCGEFELFNIEGGRFVRRVGKLDHSDLLGAIRQNLVREVPISDIESLCREAPS